MITPISFKGQVFLAGNTKSLTKNDELAYIQRYADENDCDIFVYDRSYYIGGAGKYKTILTKVDDDADRNFLANKTFDFQKGSTEATTYIYNPKVEIK